MARPFFNLYTRDFRDGVRRLKEDEVGIYALFLTVLYDANGRVRDNDADIADDMGRDVRVWRRVRARLLELGKLVLRDGYLTNPRTTIEIEKVERVSAERARAGEAGGVASGKSRRYGSEQTAVGRTSGEDQPDFSNTSGTSSANLFDKSPGDTNKNNAEAEAIASKALALADIASSSSSAQGARDREFLEDGVARTAADVAAALVAVAGPGLDTKSPRLTNARAEADLARLIQAGCTFEDLQRVVRERTKQPRARPICGWSYFEGAALEARDARLNPQEQIRERTRPANDTSTTAGSHRTRMAGAPSARARGPRTGSIVDAALQRAAERKAREGREREAMDGADLDAGAARGGFVEAG